MMRIRDGQVLYCVEYDPASRLSCPAIRKCTVTGHTSLSVCVQYEDGEVGAFYRLDSSSCSFVAKSEIRRIIKNNLSRNEKTLEDMAIIYNQAVEIKNRFENEADLFLKKLSEENRKCRTKK